MAYTHVHLVASAVASLQQQGATSIRADHLAQFSQPAQIGNFIPDVTAFIGSAPIVVEAESAEGLASHHTAEQFRTFFSYANRTGGYFIVVVNAVDADSARRLLHSITQQTSNVRLWTF